MSSNSQRIFYFDALRVFAILCVVLLHVTGHLGEMMNYNVHTIFSLSGIFETFSNNFFRIGVDLFLMLSGALLLGRDWGIKDFFSKRIPRIAVPFLFWSLIFSIVLIASSYFIPSIDFVTHFGITDMLMVFWDTLLFKAPGSVVYWFFWMILYVYFTMPFLNKWINNSDLKSLEYFLAIWMIFVVVVYSLNNSYLLVLSEFISPIGLVVLGYYLRNGERKIFNNSKISWIFIVLPSILMLIYSYSVVNESILFVFHRYSFLVILVSIGVFNLFKSIRFLDTVSGLSKRAISSIALCSYGIYLIHSQIIMVVRKMLPSSFNFTMDYIVLFVAGFFISWIIMIILSKIPIISEYIGVK